MYITVDENIPGSECFAEHGQITRIAGRDIVNSRLQNTRALLVRSVTRVDNSLLKNTPVRFVGSTTIGTDHLDFAALKDLGIRVAFAPGCNADSAAQYTLALILLASQRSRIDLRNETVGIIGRGNVGSRLQRLLSVLGIASIANDPPLQEQGVAGLTSLEEILRCRVISLHVPLTKNGAHPTWHLINGKFLKQVIPGTLLVNTARGDVVDGEALLKALTAAHCTAALDVWPGEPAISKKLLRGTLLASPHVAGYSLDGKYNGTQMIYAEFCDWGDLPARKIQFDLPPATISLKPAMELQAAVNAAVLQACPVRRDDQQLRRIARHGPKDLSPLFDRLRSEYPGRRDFAACNVKGAPESAQAVLSKLGFIIL